MQKNETLVTYHCTWPGCPSEAQHASNLYLLVDDQIRCRALFDCSEELASYMVGIDATLLHVFVGEIPVSPVVRQRYAGSIQQTLQRLHEDATARRKGHHG